jgi:hypothetical protein
MNKKSNEFQNMAKIKEANEENSVSSFEDEKEISKSINSSFNPSQMNSSRTIPYVNNIS